MTLGTIIIPHRFRGPSSSGNGGYTCGLLAPFVDADAVEVTLRSRPPLDRLLTVSDDGDGAVLLDDEVVVAEAAARALHLEPPGRVGAEEARAAERRYAEFGEHVFPECFVCGPARAPGDGLRIFAGPVEGREGIVAARWIAREATVPMVWAAIDCPGAFAVGMSDRGETVLGRMTARILRLPHEAEPCVSVGWQLGEDGRKLFAGTALFGEPGDLLAIARQTWIVPRGNA